MKEKSKVPINVGYFSNQFASSKGHGIARYARHLFKALKLYNSRVNLFPISTSAHGSSKEIKKLISSTGLEVLFWGRIITPLSWIIFNYPLLEKGLSKHIDLVHALSLGYKIATEKPYIVTIHDIGPLTHPQFFTKKDQWFMRGSLAQAVKKADAMICVSQCTADAVEFFAMEQFGISVEDRIHVIHEGVDEVFFEKPNIKAIPDFHTVSSLLKAPFILAVGQISPRKNLQSVLEAFVLIKDDLPDLQIIMVGGNGWDSSKVRHKVIELDLDDRVHFLGYVSDELLRFLYRNAAVFVYPSLFEGFGLTILEAMASECPVITSNNTSLPEVAGESAILVNPTNTQELASKIHLVVTNNEVRRHMIHNGVQRAKQFSWDKAAIMTLNVYESIQ